MDDDGVVDEDFLFFLFTFYFRTDGCDDKNTIFELDMYKRYIVNSGNYFVVVKVM